MTRKILVIGSSNTDMVVYTEKLPLPGETVMGGEFKVFAGGKGANQAVAAARSGGDVAFLGSFGQDSFGSERIADLDREGIDTSLCKQTQDISSGVALIMVDSHAENCISVAPGTNNHLFPEDLEGIDFSSFDFVVIQQEIPFETVKVALSKARNAGCFTILNPAPACPLPEEMLKDISLLIPNQGELSILLDKPVDSEEQVRCAAREIQDKGCSKIVVTLGSKGALVVDQSGITRIEALKVQAVDTTGAGDCFIGALAASLSTGAELIEAVQFAKTASALSVQRSGAQSSIPQKEEVLAFQKNSE